MSAKTQRLNLIGDAATTRLGQAIAGVLQPGQLVLLHGNLGAGKSVLARAIVRELMHDPALEVPSPSFALVQPYQSESCALIHADLYRLTDESELVELGLFDDPEAIVLVEWPERAPLLLDRADLSIHLELADDPEARTALMASPAGTIDPETIALRFAARA